MDSETLKQQGNKKFNEGKYQSAYDLYTQAIELNPRNHLLYSNRGAALIRMQRFREAIDDLEKCIQINPYFRKAHVRLLFCLIHATSNKELIKAANERAFCLMPGFDPLHEAIHWGQDINREINKKYVEYFGQGNNFEQLKEITSRLRQKYNGNEELLLHDPEYQHFIEKVHQYSFENRPQYE
ncbi:TPR Domain containing protein [Trichomonas vaginalis G3]|uniref:TPR Domain containing protein n=1 Tax=Trichomonas vaginalis (strain ATCC PRA-98 / G3) TaxID=412133 RepID=A2DEM3_TRIV3|nr:positive regulation of catalytic activity protein [Trichomonas vaginalis G3]EAY21150.1 TPR Domain containing protein [Trichomonas vaginalis G3]KAI5522325.1 positive regulation of catalytic activity protein [Trichomonas vaginalis G3]|eukprot:XP_001582136.1 TPR Domain containing protein [Trichomonas vaginalis G3]